MEKPLLREKLPEAYELLTALSLLAEFPCILLKEAVVIELRHCHFLIVGESSKGTLSDAVYQITAVLRRHPSVLPIQSLRLHEKYVGIAEKHEIIAETIQCTGTYFIFLHPHP